MNKPVHPAWFVLVGAGFGLLVGLALSGVGSALLAGAVGAAVGTLLMIAVLGVWWVFKEVPLIARAASLGWGLGLLVGIVGSALGFLGWLLGVPALTVFVGPGRHPGGAAVLFGVVGFLVGSAISATVCIVGRLSGRIPKGKGEPIGTDQGSPGGEGKESPGKAE